MYLQVGDQWVIWVEVQIVVDFVGRGSVDFKFLIGSLFFIVGLYLVNKVCLICQQCVDMYVVFWCYNIGDVVEVSGFLLGNVFWFLLVIFVCYQCQFVVWFFILYDEGVGVDNMLGIVQFFKIMLQGVERYQIGVDGGGFLQEVW